MGGEISSILRGLQRDILNLRQIEFTLSKPQIIELFDSLDQSHQEAFITIIATRKIDDIRAFIALQSDLSEYTLTKLRVIASNLGVKYYSTLTKLELIEAIRRVR